MKVSKKVQDMRVLDWDVETIATGFADPQWVPQKITAIAWSWIGEEKVDCLTRLTGADKMLREFLKAFNAADMVTGHNLIRFDLPILNSECLRQGFPSIGPKLVQDTIRLVKTKGFKKGQDNLGHLLKLPVDKLPLTWQQWQDAYEEKDWQTVKDRCAGDVIQHKLMRQQMLERGWLHPPRKWSP